MGDTRLLPALKKTGGKRTNMSSLESLKSGEAPGVNYGNAGDANGNGRILGQQTSQQDIAEEAESSIQQTPRAGRGKGEQDGSAASEQNGKRGSIANASIEGSVQSAAKSIEPGSAAKGGATPAKAQLEPAGRPVFVGQGLGAQINKAINAMNQSLFDEIRQETEARQRKLALMSKLRGGVGGVARSARNRLPREPRTLNQDLNPITEQLASSLLLPMAQPLSARNDIKIQDKNDT